MPSQRSVPSKIWGTVARVFPRCNVISQAIAFNVFLAFFPTLLLAVGLASSWIGTRAALLDTIRDFTQFLPPGSQGIVAEFLTRRGADVWKFALLGWVGSLIGGSQVMKLVMDGIHLIYGDEESLVFFPLVAMILAMLALAVIYWVARPDEEERLVQVLPGAVVATLLWWLVNAAFGLYVRRVSYSVLYGGLAAVIGLLIWMQISAVIVLLGAAWNAEEATHRQSR